MANLISLMIKVSCLDAVATVESESGSPELVAHYWGLPSVSIQAALAVIHSKKKEG
ncbi:hypothetical protein [Legionella maioricensis]|uniref:Uncharacterized protein n=1 Tax=Legionella maioricensis TaxID=2896528 RepID=A0A9X2D3L6_9GAMM|nr:hypothetical protein [Legionella maioricensis]MCL9685843.1 hypothetical protein [Legionella maioricensis]MCL9689249.1 hypothetical protein [Legionella maioricensis]